MMSEQQQVMNEKTKKEYFFKKGDIFTPDEQYNIGLPFDFFKTLAELHEEYLEDDLLDESLINAVNENKNYYDSAIAMSGIYVVVKDIKITYEY